MKLNDRTLTAITAVCLAVGVGTASFFLRSDDAATPIDGYETAEYLPGNLSKPTQDSQGGLMAASFAPVTIQGITTLPAPNIDWKKRATKTAPKVFAALTPAPKEPAVPQFDSRIPEGGCNIKLHAQAKRAARVLLAVTAQCHPKTEITIEHAGLRFRELLDAKGEISLIIPAFAQYSTFDVTLHDGSKASTGAFIAGLSSLNRVGISWQGENNALLHAYETSGPQGHIWRDKPRSYKQALLKGGGYLALLGNPDLPNPSLAQIYTAPNAAFQHQKFISLSVEIMPKTGNCGSPLKIQTAQHNPNSGWSKSRFQVTQPECGEGTNSLVLNNVVKDMRMAQNQ